MSAPVTIEQLIGLNREIAALVRAGVPLEQGLRRAAAAGREPESHLSVRLSGRMEQGASLGAALEAEGQAIPSAYRAIVEAGQRAGRLPEALEAVAGLAATMQELRRRIRLSAVYPLIVAACAYGLLVFAMHQIVPRFSEMARSMRLPPGRVLPVIEWIQQRVDVWGPAIPIAVVILIVLPAVLRGIGGASLFDPGGSLLNWLPGLGRIRTNLQRGWHCQLLAALLEHNVPLPEALELAGDSLGTGRLQQSSHKLADELRSGKSLAISLAETPEFSPLTRWLMSVGEGSSDLVAVLRRGADLLLARGRTQAEMFQSLVPILSIVLIGGGAATVYALTIFGPLGDLLNRLTVEPFM
jgi:general secretion pathway protein F